MTPTPSDLGATPAPTWAQTAQRWLKMDPDPVTRAQTRMLLVSDEALLADHFGARVAFGTAGIRAALGPGPNRMNRVVVRQTAAGLARHLTRIAPHAARHGVVIARDARHGSAAFLGDLDEVLRSYGIATFTIDRPEPTPLLSFAVLHLGSAAGVMVTASHNPRSDNGLKVYWSDGAQIVPPHDAEIAAAIAEVDDEGLAGILGPHIGDPARRGDIDVEELERAYLDRLDRLVPGPPTAPVRVAFTSLHGVGHRLLDAALGRFGITGRAPVPEQAEPDPDFPTVPSPNPEEPSALARCIATATATGAQLALALDPDADRLAVAVPGRDGAWRQLSGDEVGVLLAWDLLRRSEGWPDRLVVTTCVSSQRLARMAADLGIHYAETLTGFKWLCRPALAHPDWTQVLAYEEALGYAIGPGMRDKDGIAAALCITRLVCDLTALGRTVDDELDELDRTFGVFATHNISTSISPEARACLDELVGHPPHLLAGCPVVACTEPNGPGMVRIDIEGGHRVVLRPSGTEPKLKIYCEATIPVPQEGAPDDTSLTSIRVQAALLADRLAEESLGLLRGSTP